MPPFIDTNWSRLARRHYLRNASAANHWFDFTDRRVQSFARRYGSSFCLVVNGSHETDDAYVIPYGVASQLLTSDKLDRRGRWIGTIERGQMKLAGFDLLLPVRRFHNSFGQLAE